jgi:hypothetical protein
LDSVRPATCFPGHTLAHTAASRTARHQIQCGWLVTVRAAARAAGIPAAPVIRGSRAASPVKEGFLIYLKFQKIVFPFEKS